MVCKSAHAGDIIVTGGDFNSSIGTNSGCKILETDSKETRNREMEASGGVGPFGIHHQNDAGRRLHSHIASKDFATCSTYFTKKQYGTWTHPRTNTHASATTEEGEAECDGGGPKLTR